MPLPSPHTPLVTPEGDCSECNLPLRNRIHQPAPENDATGSITGAVDTPSTPVGVHHPRTSHDAAVRALPKSGTIRSAIFTIIANRPQGATDDELEQTLNRTHQSVSAARNSLMGHGLIEALTDGQGAPVTRRTRSGNDATAWRPSAAARALMGQP